MRLIEKSVLLALCLFGLTTIAVNAQLGIVDKNAKKKPTLVVLGTYHMGTPGNNVVNPKVADIAAPERQKQIAGLIKRLKQFKPTKIVLECDHPEADAKTQADYDKYLSGNYQLSKSETDQIGFRLAKELGRKRVYCVDSSGLWDDSAMNYEKYASKHAELDKFLKETYRNLKEEIDAEFAKLYSLSVTDQLILLNRPERMDRDHRRYYDLMRVGLGKDYVGANYFSWWYGRNLTILTNIIRLTDSPSDRILVIYGAGHAKLLNQFAHESMFFTTESPLKYLEGRK